MPRREAVEEDSHAVVEVIDSRTFDGRIGFGHVGTAVNRRNVVEKEVASSVEVQLSDGLACFVRRGLHRMAYQVQHFTVSGEDCISDLRIPLVPGPVDVINAEEETEQAI